MSEATGVQATPTASPAVETPSAPMQGASADPGAVSAPEPGTAVTGDVTPGQEQGQTIPYDRFQQVVQQRNAYEAKAKEQEQSFAAQVAQLQAQLQQSQQPDPLIQKLKQAFQPEPEVDPYKDPLEASYEALQAEVAQLKQAEAQRAQAAQVAQYERYYNGVIEQAKQEFPHASETDIKWALYNSANNPSAAMEVAKQAARASHEGRVQWARDFKVATPPPQGMVSATAQGFTLDKAPEDFSQAADIIAYALQNGAKL